MEIDRAYEAPRSETIGLPEAPGAPGHTPGGALYSPEQVATACFIGSPFAAALLLARNFKVLGQPGRQRSSIAWGVVASGVLVAVALRLPEKMPHAVIPAAYTFASLHLARSIQGEAFQAHLKAGGRKHSTWRAVGIAALCLIGFLAAAFVVLLTLDLTGIYQLPDE